MFKCSIKFTALTIDGLTNVLFREYAYVIIWRQNSEVRVIKLNIAYINDIMYLVSNPPNHQDIIKVAKKLCVTLEDNTKFETFGMSLLGTTNNEDVKMILLECQEKPPGPVAKYKRLLEVWKEHTPESECRWEKVIDVLHKMNYTR